MTDTIKPEALAIRRGSPTPEQLAAVVAALTVLQSRAAQQAANEQPQSRWARPHLRQPLPHGQGMWRHSLRNR